MEDTIVHRRIESINYELNFEVTVYDNIFINRQSTMDNLSNFP